MGGQCPPVDANGGIHKKEASFKEKPPKQSLCQIGSCHFHQRFDLYSDIKGASGIGVDLEQGFVETERMSKVLGSSDVGGGKEKETEDQSRN